MKNLLLISCAILFVAQTGFTQTRTVKKVLELQMPKTKEDKLCGTNGASVCWNPLKKLYYAAFAGNSGFPMAVFNASGKRVSNEDLTTMEDLRGIWYDPTTRKLNANGYNDIGWMEFTLDASGIPTKLETKFSGLNQPTSQSVAAYDSRLKKVFFLDYSRLMLYEDFSGLFTRVDDSVLIHWGRTQSQGPASYEDEYESNEDYNYTTVIATGIRGSEFGVLNTLDKKIELYDIANGYLKKSFKLPADAPVENAMNFAYANGIYWLFDIKNRKWVGYK